jgi:hypothetical protein
MTRKEFNKVSIIVHDIDVLENIQRDIKNNYCIKFNGNGLLTDDSKSSFARWVEAERAKLEMDLRKL